jgi:hypothetical protein
VDVSRNGSVGPYCRRPPFFVWHESIWDCNHEPPDHGAFDGKFLATTSSGNSVLKSFFLFYCFGFLLIQPLLAAGEAGCIRLAFKKNVWSWSPY